MPGGPRAYRLQIRRLGAVAGLLLPGVLGALALLLHAGSGSALRGMSSFLLAVLAAPVLLVAGVPLRSGTGTYAIAMLASAALWLAFGAVASLRATRRPASTWRDFWREYAWLAGGVWVGVGAALLVADLMLGRPVL